MSSSWFTANSTDGQTVPIDKSTSASIPPRRGESVATRWSILDRMRGAEAEEAWRWFLERYRPVVRAVLARHLPSRDLTTAADEFWSYLFTSRVFETAKRERRFRTFLCGVAGNYARDWRRRHGLRRAATGRDETALEPEAPDAGLEEEEFAVWARHLLGLGLERLRREYPDSAAAVAWFYGVSEDGSVVDPVKVAEIARRLDRTVSAIHQSLHRGRARLRTYIEAELAETVGDADALADETMLFAEWIGTARPGLLG